MSFYETATRLLSGQDGREPSESDLRRAVSTTYYALFHDLAELCADQLAGASQDKRTRSDWQRIYRALEHGRMENVMDEIDPARKAKNKRGIASDIDQHIEFFGETLERLKKFRHTADYDPAPFQLSSAEVRGLIDDAIAAALLMILATDKAKRELAFACIVSRRRV